MIRVVNMDWSNDKIMEFIANYESEPILWNPNETGHKRKDLCYDAWVRIKNNLNWSCTVEDLKKKRDSLMAYYRQHLNKKKKSIKSGAGTDDIYHVNWFAFGALNSFLQPIYDCKQTIHTQINEENDQGMTSVAAEESTSRAGDANTQQAKRARYDLSSEINTARQQMNEAFNHVKNNSYNDEYEFFGKLIASKLRKIQNPNIREILMNDIHNIVFKAYMVDRLNEPTAGLPQSFLQTNNLSDQQHQSPRSPVTQQHQSPQSSFSQQHQSPQSPFSQQHQSPQSPFSQQHQSPQSPFSQQHQSPQSPFSQQHQSPQSPFSQQHQSPQSPFSQQHQSPQSPFSQQHQLPQSPYSQQHQSPQTPSHYESSQSVPIPSTSFQSDDQNSNIRILPPRKASQIIISELGEITLADIN